MSGPNAKFSVEGGSLDSDGTFLALGSYTLPIGTTLGLQMDGAIGSIDDEVMGGGGAHLFARDPDKYLIGLYGSYHTWNDIDIWRVAAEAELYMGRFSFSGIAGYESVDVPSFSSGLAVLNQDEEHAFANLQLAYYPIDNLKLSGGYRYVSETSLGTANAEYLIQDAGVPISIFAKGDFGEDDFNRVTGGLKVYLGADPSKTLIERHRTEDPQNYTPAFPSIQTQSSAGGPLPQCVVNTDHIVDSPTDGQCLCPSGSLAGQKPTYISPHYRCPT